MPTREETETKIQFALYQAFWKSLLLLPNIHLFKWESDLLGINKKGEIFEFEIKLTRADFLRDFEKSKHKIFQNASKTARIPSRFYFVCPNDQITLDEIPSYAGLFWCDSLLSGSRAWEKKRAPILTNYRIDPRHLRRALVSVTARYWLLKGERTYWNK